MQRPPQKQGLKHIQASEMPALKLTETGQATYLHKKHSTTQRLQDAKMNIRISPDAAQCHHHDLQFQASV